MRSYRPLGFTLIELVVVLAVIAIVLALSLAGIQQAREASRRSQCVANLRQIGLAIHEFEAAHQQVPPGGNRAGNSFLVLILPYLEQSAILDRLDLSAGPVDETNRAAWSTAVASYRCPSDSNSQAINGREGTSYAGCFGSGVQRYGYNGVFRHAAFGRVRLANVTDGLSNTAAVGEILMANQHYERRRVIFRTPVQLDQPDEFDEFVAACSSADLSDPGVDVRFRGVSWTHGDAGRALYNHVLGPNANSCTNHGFVQPGAYSAASHHPGGINCLNADGSVAFVEDAVDLDIWRSRASRNGGEVGE